MCRQDPFEEMYARYDTYNVPWFSVPELIDVDYAFDAMEQAQYNDEQMHIQTALAEYTEYRASVNPPTAEPMQYYKICTDKITELLK